MRGHVEGLEAQHPVGAALPALYAGHDFVDRFTAAFDEVFATVFTTLDCLPAYLDPDLAPVDFLEWLAGWVGLVVDETWTPERLRVLVGRAVELHRWRGTARGLAEHVGLAVGGTAEVVESGGSSWSPRPETALPGTDRPAVHVVVRVADPATVDRRLLDALVAAIKPAHLPHSVEVVAA